MQRRQAKLVDTMQVDLHMRVAYLVMHCSHKVRYLMAVVAMLTLAFKIPLSSHHLC